MIDLTACYDNHDEIDLADDTGPVRQGDVAPSIQLCGVPV